MTQNAGDSNEITREFLDSICIEERLLNSDLADTGFDFFGHHYSTPIMSAAFSHLEDNGGVKLARGFHKAGALNWWGMSGDEEITAIYQEGPDTVRIIKPYADSSKVYHRIAQALSFGAVGVGMDIDHAYSGNGTYDNVLVRIYKSGKGDALYYQRRSQCARCGYGKRSGRKRGSRLSSSRYDSVYGAASCSFAGYPSCCGAQI